MSSCAPGSSSSEDDPPATFGIVLLGPASGSSDASGDEWLRVRFSEKIHPTTVNASTFRLYKMFPDQDKQTDATQGTLVPGSFSFASDGMSVIFAPTQNLSHDSLYKPLLSSLDSTGATIKSESGESLVSTPPWYFRVKPLDSDNDGLSDYDETNDHNTDPNDSDSDDDGLNDYAEATTDGRDPNISDAASNKDSLYDHQWHLKNTGQTAGAQNPGVAGEDIKIEPVWAKHAGLPKIKVAVVDSGILSTHPDLAPNLNLSLSYRYSDGSNNPSPDNAQLNQGNLDYNHGTACAGLIAARGWNQLGVRGVAPFVQLVGLNVFSWPTNAAFQHALGRTDVDVSSNSWGTNQPGALYYSSGDMDAIEQGIVYGRQGKGVIYVFAAGNDNLNSNVNANFNNNRFVINVAATNAKGEKSSYTNYGANILLAAPGGEQEEVNENTGKHEIPNPLVVSTDYTGLTYGHDKTNQKDHFNVAGNEAGDYTNRMNGTSAATPIVAGAAALILQANPALTYRDVKYILASTARKDISPDSSDWEKLGSHHFNHNYGFGMLDVDAAVTKAKSFARLPIEKISTKYQKDENTFIPDYPGSGIESSIAVSESLTVEHVNIWVTITDHTRIWDLNIILESPTGTTSKLAYSTSRPIPNKQYNNWKFASVRHLDETSAGSWKLKVKDLLSVDTGTLTGWALQIIGH